MEDGAREDAAMRHALDIFTVSPGYHAALLNATDDYYSLIHSIASETIRETAVSFIPNVENYTMIFANLIAITMRSSQITEDHVMMASEIIYDNLHNLTIWLERVKQSDLLATYAAQQCIANITAQRRFKALREGGQADVLTSGQGGRNFVLFNWGG